MAKKIISALILSVMVVVCASVASAQTNSPKRSTARKTASVQPSPTPITEPVVISRAEDYPLDGQVVPRSVTEAAKQVSLEDPNEKIIADLNSRLKALEGDKKDDYDQKQKRLALNLDILTKAEQRAESLRKQSFELVDKENVIRTRLEQITSELRSESIDRSIAFTGSLRPEELRAARKKSLESERTNQTNMLTELQRARTALDINAAKADLLVERLRVKLEAEIDAALGDTPTKP